MRRIDSTVDNPNAHAATRATFPKGIPLNVRPKVDHRFVRTESSFQLRHA
jgi:hypothetical protein